MAGGNKVMSNAVVATALVALLVVAAASSAAAWDGDVCGINPQRLKKECSSYCKAGSTESRPSGACCAAASGAQFGCLCRFKGMLPPDMDPNRAMQIPSQCGVNGAPTGCYRA